MVAVVVLVNVVFPPTRPSQPAPAADTTGAVPPAPQPEPQQRAAAAPVHVPDQLAATPGTVPSGTTAASTRADTIVVESPIYRFKFSTLGARLVSASLLRYEDFASETDGPVQLKPADAPFLVAHNLRTAGQFTDLANVNFAADQPAGLVLNADDRGAALAFTGVDANGRAVQITYSFLPNEYTVDVAIRAPGANQVVIDYAPTLAINEANAAEDQRALAYVYNSQRQGITSVPLRKVKGPQRTIEGPLTWVALKNKYFLVAAMQQDAEQSGFGGIIVSDGQNEFEANIATTLETGTDSLATYQLFVGPQEYERLLALGRGLEDVNPYGWRWLRPIIRPIGHALTWLMLETHNATNLAYGWVLVLFGIAVRVALWPLNAKAMRSQLKSMELQPRIKAIQERWAKADPQRFQQEMLKLYKEEKFNPMGGCFPLLLPMPVLITLFFVFQGTIEFRGVSWMWLPDLSLKDPLYILPILLGVTMFLQQYVSMKSMPPNPQMKFMMWFMPGFMTFLFLNFASGLNLYYLAQNFAAFPQQLQLMKERQRFQAQRAVATTEKPARRNR